MTVASALIPLASVLLGAWITYAANVRQRRRSKVEDVLHEAIAAVAVAHAGHNFVAKFEMPALVDPLDAMADVVALKREGLMAYGRACHAARAAIARASAYDASLRRFLGPGFVDVYPVADEIMDALRASLDRLPRSHRH